MASLVEVRAGLRTQLNTITGIETRVDPSAPPPGPALLVALPNFEYWRTFGGTGTIEVDWPVWVTHPSGLMDVAFDAITRLVDWDGSATTSVPGCILNDTTIGGTVEDCKPYSHTAPDLVEWAGAQVVYSVVTLRTIIRKG